MDEHEHVWGPLEQSRLAGTFHRKCTVEGCKVINAYDGPENTGSGMMDIRDAWHFLAELWGDIQIDERGIAFPTREGYRHCAGICPCINELIMGGEITEAEAEEMTAVIMKLPEWKVTRGLCEGDDAEGFRWEPNEEGAKQRVAFCLAQAREC